MHLRNGRAGIVDLASGEASEEEIADDAFFGDNEGLRIADELQAKHGGDALVLGTGLLTGSLVPAACAGFVVGKRAPSGSRRIAPILGLGGVELKLTGFDFVVVKGRASEHGYLWIRDGIIEYIGAPDTKALDSWSRTDKIREAQGDHRIQVITTGPWGDASARSSQFLLNYWGGEDKVGLGGDLGGRNLLAVAFRGMGELEVADAEKHFEDGSALSREHVRRLGRNSGLASYTDAAGTDEFSALVHRHVTCFGCPFPCRSFLKVNEDPKEMRLAHPAPGYLHYDISALDIATQAAMGAKELTLALIACAKKGAEPSAVIAAAKNLGGPHDAVAKVLARSPREAPRRLDAKNLEAAFGDEASYLKCLGLGLCPRYWSKVGFDLDSISSCTESALGRRFDR